MTPESTKALREVLGEGWKIFTDTPLDVWAADREGNAPTNKQNKPPAKATSEPVRAAFKDDSKIVCRLAADYIAHSAMFTKICAHFGAELVELSNAKYTDGPMSALITFKKEHAQVVANNSVEPISFNDDGLWYLQIIPKRV